MGLFNFNPDLNDPKTQLLITMGLGLLGGNPRTNKNFGADMAYAGMNGLGAYSNARQYQMQEQAMERQNRASDLQELSGVYNVLKQQEFGRLAQGLPPNPLIPQIESRMSDLIGQSNLSGIVAPNKAPVSNGQTPMAGAPGPAAAAHVTVPAPPPASAPTTNGPLGGPAFGVPMAAYLASDPTGKTYLDALQKQGTPISTRFGVYTMDQGNPSTVKLAGGMIPQNALNITPGPNGPSIAPIPGQLDTIKSLVNAQKAGEAPYDIKMVPTASGAEVPMSVAQLAGESKPVAKVTPQAQAPSAAPAQGTFTDVPKRYQPQGLGQTTFDKEMAAAQAKSASEIAAKLGSQADAANQRIALNNQAMDLVDQADTGPKATQIADVKNWLVSRFGVPEASFANSPSASQALQKDLLNAATQRAKQQFGSRITQSEVMLMLTRGAPNVDMTKAAIKYLITSDNAMLGYQVKQADDFGKYLQAGGDPMRFEAWYAKSFPASQTLGQVKLQTKPANIDDLVNKYRTKPNG